MSLEAQDRKELSRLSDVANRQWQDWLHNSAASAEREGLNLIELVHGLSDMRAKAHAMRLDFLDYLLGMAFEETLRELSARDART